MRYLPHTRAEIEAMLEVIGVDSIDALFEPIPKESRAKPLELEPALDEGSLMRHLTELSRKNDGDMLSFLGAGMYDHQLPPAMDQLLLRSEFYTAYTPYQAEVSQGTLQAIFEFQTMVCDLFGQEVANASMYDAASGAAEAVLMARRVTKKHKVVLSEALHPHVIETIHTYLRGLDGAVLEGQPDIVTLPVLEDGTTNLEPLAEMENVAAVLVGYPNVFGCVENLQSAADAAHESGALLVSVTCEPYALSLLKPPGELGADISVGEGQALAVPPQFGGPGVGLFSCKSRFVRQMPGRLVGETVDADGKRGFVLTLSTREQHIRREKATSNICTNHGLIALAFAIRTAMLGKSGFRRAGDLCLSGAEYLKAKIGELPAFSIPLAAPTFNEFLVRRTSGDAAPVLALLAADGILGGVDMSRLGGRSSDFLVAVTEKHTRADLDRLVASLAKI